MELYYYFYPKEEPETWWGYLYNYSNWLLELYIDGALFMAIIIVIKGW